MPDQTTGQNVGQYHPPPPWPLPNVHIVFNPGHFPMPGPHLLHQIVDNAVGDRSRKMLSALVAIVATYLIARGLDLEDQQNIAVGTALFVVLASWHLYRYLRG